MKEIVKKILAVIVIALMICNSSMLTLISVAIDEIEDIVDISKVNINEDINLEKYVNYSFGDKKGLLVKLHLKTGIEYKDDQQYKSVKSTLMVLNAPMINNQYPENIEIIGNSTNDFLHKYNQESGKFAIQTLNEDNTDFTINLYYDSNCYSERAEEKNIEISGIIKDELSDSNSTEIEKQIEKSVDVSEDISGLVSEDIYADEIFKGFIKANKKNGTEYDTSYNENLKLNFDYKEIGDEITFENTTSFINRKNEIFDTDEVIYKSTKINKNEVLDLLGQDGNLQIEDSNSNILFEINKETEAQEDGTVQIDYQNEVGKIVIRTTKPEKNGVISINNVRSIKSSMLNLDVDYVRTNVEVKCKNNQEVIYSYNAKNDLQLKETETRADLKIDNTNWTNYVTNEVNFNVVLLNNLARYDLFNKPVIEIKLPEEVDKVVLGDVSLLYENGLNVKNVSVVERDNFKVIRLELDGKQNEYYMNPMVEGSNIIIPASIIIKKDAIESQANVSLTYSNDNSSSIDYINEGKTSKEYNINIESVNKTEVENIKQYEQVNESSNYVETMSQNNSVSSNIKAMVGSKQLNNNDEVYEDQIIKYSVKLKNETNSKIENIDIIGNIPDGTKFATVDNGSDYKESDDYYDLYKYVTDETKEQYNEKISLEAGEEKELYYEVKVSKLNDGSTEKQINSNIYVSINGENIAEYSMNNVVKPAEMSVELKSWRTEREDNLWVYDIYLYNNLNKDINNLNFEMQLPEQFKFTEVADDFPGKISENNGKLSITMDSLKANSRSDLLFFVKLNETNPNANQYYIINSVVVQGENTKVYYSNENRLTAYTSAIEVTQTSDREGEDVSYGSTIDYNFVIKNVSDENYFRKSVFVNLKDFLDENVEGISAKYETFDEDENGAFVLRTETCDFSEDLEDDENGEINADFDVDVEIPTGKSVNVWIKVQAGVVYEKTPISNKMDLTYDGKTKSSNIIKNNIVKVEDVVPTPDPDPNPDPTPDPEPGDDSNKKYNISGVAWIDKNSDGQISGNEEKYSNLKVKLFNAETGEIVKDKNNKNFEVETDNSGKYKFTDVPTGNYLVLFEYDNSQYSLSPYKATNVDESVNSNVIEKEVNIDGNISKVAISDILQVNSVNIEYINIGLVPRQKFDFSLNKTINKVSMVYNGNTTEKVFDSNKLAKIEVPAKQISNTTIVVEYQIEVKNEGDIAGYVDEIIDYIPSELEFNSELNTNWFKTSDGNLKTSVLASKRIEPGETQSVKLYLTKNLTSNTLGTIKNGAEIAKSSNDKGTADVDSIVGNKNTGEDDYSEAQLIIAIKTGAITYTLIILGILLTLISLKILIDNKLINQKNIKLFMFAFLIVGIMSTFNYTEAALTRTEVQSKLEDKYKNVTYNLRYGDGKYVHHWDKHTYNQLYCSDGMALCGHEDHIYKFSGIKNFSSKKVSSKTTGSEATFEVLSGKPSITDLNDNYNKVGPYKVKYNGKLTVKTVYANSGQLSNYKIIDASGNVIKIQSKEEFYIRIPKSVTKIVKVDVVVKTDEALKVTEKYETKYTEIWKCSKLCVGKGGSPKATQVMNRDRKETKEKEIPKSSSKKGKLPGTGKVTTNGELTIKKVDSRDEEIPLENVGFTISTKIKVWKFKGTEIAHKACEHWNSGYYSHAYDVSNGKHVPCTHWNSGYYSHNYDTWTKNIYEQVEKTMYLGSNNQWRDTPYTFFTDSEGIISISNISLPDPLYATNVETDGDSKTLEAEYVDNNATATEVINNYYGYECNTSSTTFNILRSSSETQVLTNEQKYVKLSGYVWEDGHSGKEDLRNDEYDEGEESGVNGITVYLKDKSGSIVKQTTSGTYNGYSEINGGQYVFENVNLGELEKGNYHIEFEYDGFKHEDVEVNLYENNTSKAADTSTRDILNNKFTSVDGNGSQSLYINGININYSNINNHVSSISSYSGMSVIASTDEAGYNIYDDFQPTMSEIRYINLGITEKEQTNYALTKDLYNVRVEVNGRSHVYRYGTTRYDEYGNPDFVNPAYSDVYVKFQKNNGTYTRAIYKADANYEQDNDSKNLKVYATYKIALKNQSNYLARINSIIDYCDNRFNLINAGTMIDDDVDKVSNDLSTPGGKMWYNQDYAKYIVNTNLLVYPEETEYLYLQFEVTNYNEPDGNWRKTLVSNENIALNNVAEINSYTTFKDYDTNSYLAVVDNYSVPGNAIPGRTDTYENDTDAACTFKLELGDQRSLKGKVFEDSTGKDKTTHTGDTRKGNGEYDTGETTVNDVTVRLIDTETNQIALLYDDNLKTFVNAETNTKGDGDFEFVGYIPGNYVVVYTWGDEHYKVQYYKGTIYDVNRTKGPYWYRGSEYSSDGVSRDDTISRDLRKSDALDDHQTRMTIDEQMAKIKNNTIENEINKLWHGGSESITIKTMDSTTPNMEMSVEYPTDVTDGTKKQEEFEIKNVDFGIVERAKQELELKKRVSGYKITLANGQTLVNATIDENGEITGTYPYTINQKPSQTYNGLIKTEMDNELIEGAKLEIEYTMTVKNISELDYTTWDYYDYGIIPSDDKLVTISVSELLDYVDGRLSVVDDKWNSTDKNHLKDVNASEKDSKDINELKPYITDKLTKPLTPKSPNNVNTVKLQTSKLLTSTDDNEFNNKSEITQVEKPDGPVRGIPVKVTWGSDTFFHFNTNDSQTITILPSTGANKNYATPIIIVVCIIVIFGVGIVLIKKFVIDK